MQILWCWRCQRDMPMLDEGEYERVAALLAERFAPALEALVARMLDG